jgi:hypothetical protein
MDNGTDRQVASIYPRQPKVFGTAKDRHKTQMMNRRSMAHSSALGSGGPMDTQQLLAEWQQYLTERPLPTDDPRPDIWVDHNLWATLLPLAHGHGPEELFGALHGLRCLGAGLAKLGGRVQLTHGAIDPRDYQADREKYLIPHAQQLVMILEQAQKLAQGMGDKAKADDYADVPAGPWQEVSAPDWAPEDLTGSRRWYRGPGGEIRSVA